MDEENEFEIRPGRIRSKSAQRQRPLVAQALAAAQKAGANLKHGRISRGGKTFGRGRRATLIANRMLSNQSRLAVIKARVVRHSKSSQLLKAHLRYLQREGVTTDGERAVLFGRDSDNVDRSDFGDRCADDRHHFRFIVSPEDAPDVSDLRQFTRDLMRQAEGDLGTRLDWVGVSHWNTEHPHIHVILRGRTDTGEDLVISRDYIREGMRARAQMLLTDELGPRTDIDIRKALHRQIEAERFTQLDRQLMRDGQRFGYVDLAPSQTDQFQVLKAGRVRKLEALGLAEQFAPGQWILSPETEPTLRALGERGDIIKRLHRALSDNQIDQSSEKLMWTDMASTYTVIGKLLDRGLDDELKGTAYAIVDGVDGRTHHLTLPSLEATSDARIGAIVSLSRTKGDEHLRTLKVASDFDLKAQVGADGPTWLDRATVEGTSDTWAQTGFGGEARQAQRLRLAVLTDRGLSQGDGGRSSDSSNLLARLERDELRSLSTSLQNRLNRPLTEAGPGAIAGRLIERVDASARRYALLDTGNGLQLVPWSPALSSSTGEWVTGRMRANGSMSWDIGRSRGIEIQI